MERQRRKARIAVGVLLVVSFALRLWRLGDQNLWWDEALAVWAVRKTLAGVTLWTAGDVHPPLFFWTLWGWIRLAGESPFAVRYVTVAWGMLSVCLAYALGRHLAGPRGGLLALALVGLSRFEVWWSMELRMYMLAGMCVLGATYSLLRWLRRPASSWPLVLYGVLAITALYTLYMSAAVLVLLNLVALVAIMAAARSGVTTSRALRRWLTVQVVVAAAYLPWLAVALPRLSSWRVPGEAASMGFVVHLWATLTSTGISTDVGAVRGWVVMWWVAAILAMVVCLAGWMGSGRRSDLSRRFGEGRHGGLPLRSRRDVAVYRGRFGDERVRGVAEMARHAGWAPTSGGDWLGPVALALVAISAPVVVWAATQPRSIFYSPQVEARYFVPFAGPLYVLVAWGLARAWSFQPRLTGLLLMVLLSVQLLSLPGHYARRHLRDVTQSMSIAIWSQAEEGDAVVLVSGNRYPLFRYDYDRDPSAPPVIEFPTMGSEPVTDHADWEEDLDAIAARYRRLWLVELDHELQDPDRFVFGWLSQHRRLALSEGYGPNALHLFNADGAPPQANSANADWPGLVTWSLVELQYLVIWPPVEQLYPGDQFNVTLVADSIRRASDVEMNLIDGFGMTTWTGQSTGGHGSNRRRISATVDGRWPRELRGRGGQVLAREVLSGTSLTSWTRLDLNGMSVVGAPRRLAVGLECSRAETVGPVRLCHFRTTDRANPGAQVILDLYWKGDPAALAALRPTTTVFAHLIGPPRSGSGDRVWAAGDGLPSSGAWSLPRYERSARSGGAGLNGPIFDRHVLSVDPAAPLGSYEVEVGLYDPTTGTRYPVGGELADVAGDRLILGTVEVVAPSPVDRIIRNISLLWR